MTRPAATTGNQSLPASAGAHGGTRANYEIIRMPSGSIVSIPRIEPALEPLDLSKARLNKALVFALAINFLAWGFILLAGRALASVFL